jgi:hypothetical protein
MSIKEKLLLLWIATVIALRFLAAYVSSHIGASVAAMFAAFWLRSAVLPGLHVFFADSFNVGLTAEALHLFDSLLL